MTIDGKLATGHQFPNVWVLISSTHRSHGRMDPGCSNHRTPTCFGAKVHVAHAVAAPDPRPQPLRTQGKHWALGNSNISMGIYPQNMALYGFTWYSTSIFGSWNFHWSGQSYWMIEYNLQVYMKHVKGWVMSCRTMCGGSTAVVVTSLDAGKVFAATDGRGAANC